MSFSFKEKSCPSVFLRTKYDKIRDCNSSQKLSITYFGISKSLFFLFSVAVKNVEFHTLELTFT